MTISGAPFAKPGDRNRWLQCAHRVICAGTVSGMLIWVIYAPRQEAQILPVTAQAQIGGQTIALEVAKTPEQRSRGFMYRTERAPNRGMLWDLQELIPSSIMR